MPIVAEFIFSNGGVAMAVAVALCLLRIVVQVHPQPHHLHPSQVTQPKSPTRKARPLHQSTMMNALTDPRLVEGAFGAILSHRPVNSNHCFDNGFAVYTGAARIVHYNNAYPETPSVDGG